MPTIYSEAESVQKIAEGLIANYHPELADAKFRFLFKDKVSKKNGRPVMGTVAKMNDRMLYLIEVDFLLEIPEEIWRELDNTKRTALVDHLLERCTGEEDEKTGTMKWKVRDPDVHEFNSIMRRYGAWTDELSQFASVAKSLDFDFMTSDEEEEEDEGEEVEQSTRSSSVTMPALHAKAVDAGSEDADDDEVDDTDDIVSDLLQSV